LCLVTRNVLQLWTTVVPVFPTESRFYGLSALFQSHKIPFGMPNFPGFSNSQKHVSHTAYEHYDFPTVEENIHRRRTDIRATNSKEEEERERDV